MYIPEFVCGVLATVLIEFIALIVYGIVSTVKNSKK